MEKTNLFNIHDAFFVIDSDNLQRTSTELYGYMIADGELIEDAAALKNRELSLEGAYVYIENTDGHIRIHQDIVGSYGLYLFREGDYFAISNSFFYLMDHIKYTHKITFNQDYATYLILTDKCVDIFEETLVNEIKLLDRNVTVDIDTASGKMEFTHTDFFENTISPTSEEGIRILDNWYAKWTGIIRKLQAQNRDLQFALSGGFDSRMTFNLLLGAGVDMSRVFVHSINDDAYTHAEDYKIASEIASYYGFELNKTDSLCQKTVNYTVDDSLNMSYYLKLGIHKQMYHQLCRFEKPRFYFGGAGGETIRGRWAMMTDEDYIKYAFRRRGNFPREAFGELEGALRRVMDTTFRQMRQKFEGFGRSIAPEDISFNLYRETRCRAHFGKDFIEKYYGGIVKYSPLLDPELQKLSIYDEQCSDRHLLMTLMLDRYHPKLLDFPFQGDRSINEETIAYVKSINAKFPYVPAPAEAIPVSGEAQCGRVFPVGVNPPITEQDVDAESERIFTSDRVRSTFEMVYGERFYNNIREQTVNYSFSPLRDAYCVIAIARVLQDVLENEDRAAPTIVDSFRSAALAKPVVWDNYPNLRSHECLDNYITARFDIRFIGSPENKLSLEVISDPTAKVNWPAWMAKNGSGCTIESKKGELELLLRCTGTGRLTLAVRGRDVRGADTKRIPFWIDLHEVRINGESCMDEVRPVWHDEPLQISRDTADGDEVRIFLRWEPHDERKHPIPVKEPPAPKAEPPKQKKGLLGKLLG